MNEKLQNALIALAVAIFIIGFAAWITWRYIHSYEATYEHDNAIDVTNISDNKTYSIYVGITEDNATGYTLWFHLPYGECLPSFTLKTEDIANAIDKYEQGKNK